MLISQISLIVSLWLAMSAVSADPSIGVDDPEILSVLAVNEHLNAEMRSANASAVQERLSDQFVATDPSNTVRSKNDLVAIVSSGLLKYDSIETEIDVAKRLGDDLVVLMGVETTTQSAVPTGGELKRTATTSTLKRRFTNLYRKEDGNWRLLVKQSTVMAVE